MDHIRELDCVTDEEDLEVVADQVPVPVFGEVKDVAGNLKFATGARPAPSKRSLLKDAPV